MECILGRVKQCKDAESEFQKEISDSRFDAIIDSSKRRQDGLHEYIKGRKDSITIQIKCISFYASNTLITRIEKRRNSEDLSQTRSEKQLRSDAPKDICGENFDFKKHCLFCIDVTPCKVASEYPQKYPKISYKPCTSCNYCQRQIRSGI